MLPLPVLCQYWLGLLIRVIKGGHVALCHPAITVFQFHGIVPGILLGTLWLLSGWIRLQELRRLRRLRLLSLQRGEGCSSVSKGVEEQGGREQLPAVSIILPVRGCRSHSLSNWQSVINLRYDGPLEFIFVLESKLDPAFAAITQLLLKRQGSPELPTGDMGQNGSNFQAGKLGTQVSPNAGNAGKRARVHRVIFSGAACQTSQKIHNLIAGLTSADPSSKYALCLDDDVQLQPDLLTWLVKDMEADSSLFMATGYPFDVPPPDANILTYAVMSYHMPLVIAFSTRQRIEFVWGGCQLFRLSTMQEDTQGLMKAWSEGGYSDDLTVASKCTEQQLAIYCPSYAIFPQWVDGDYSLRRWWNYLRRQLYVLDTYSNPHNRRTNHIMALLHCYGSWGFVIPFTTVVLRCALWSLAVVLLPTQHVYGGPGQSSYLWLELFGAEGCSWGVVSAGVFVGFTAFMMGTLRWMTGVILALFLQLNPALTPRQLDTFSWWKVWAGFYISNAVLPVCMAYTFLTSHINWAGIVYRRHRGRIVSVKHTAF